MLFLPLFLPLLSMTLRRRANICQVAKWEKCVSSFVDGAWLLTIDQMFPLDVQSIEPLNLSDKADFGTFA
jgi:hypothetical protein